MLNNLFVSPPTPHGTDYAPDAPQGSGTTLVLYYSSLSIKKITTAQQLLMDSVIQMNN